MFDITIDGKTLSLPQADSLLKAATDAGINIPNLCDFSHSKAKQQCNLCQVQIKNHDGSLRCVRACETALETGLEVITQSSYLSKIRQEALENILSDHFADCEAPCQTACPAGVDVQSYLYHIGKGDYKEAVKVIKKTLPLPLSIGRVCPAFCEAECRRGLVDEPVAIRQLKRHAADLDLADLESYVPPKAPATNKRIAIIGSGPAGLTTGYYLSNNGHDVTIMESAPKAGGWLRYGIPEYRLPKDILDKEIELLTRNGLKIKTGCALGRDTNLTELVANYDAVCLAIGAQKAVPMNYPGSDLQGCYLGVDYLRDYCTDKKFITGKKVAVIGGGNTAIDCARTAVRDGADVTLIYRRSRDEMPAEPYEIHEAEEEGVKFHFLTNPIENHSDSQGRVKSVTFAKMALGEPDTSGRRSPKATGVTFEEAFDTVIPAVSQQVDLDFLDQPENQIDTGHLALTRWHTFLGCEQTMSAGIEKLFVIGDSRTGPGTAVGAVADGRKAAEAIEGLLTDGLTCHLEQGLFNSRKANKTASLSAELYPDLYPEIAKRPRLKMPELSQLNRTLNFAEVELGFVPDEAMKEAMRCLECACQANTDCKLRDYATEYKVDGKTLDQTQARKFKVDNSAPFITFDANRCISCGACVEACHQQSGHNVICFEPNSYQALPDATTAGIIRNAPRVGFTASMNDSDCVQCGNCVQACPTGALVDARDKTQGTDRELTKTSTVCTYCGVGCRVELHVDQQTNHVMRVTGDTHSLVNEGMLCVKGRSGFDFLNSPKRLTTPLIRKNGQLQPASWNEAISYISEQLQPIKDAAGPSKFAALSSAKCTNEENYLMQKFTRSIMGTNSIDHCARLCHSSTVAGLSDTIGGGAMTNDIPSIKDSDVIFIIGSDTTSAHPIIASHIKRAVSQHGARLIVADPKKTTIADSANLYVSHRPGTDVMLLNAIMQQIIINDWQDADYINNRVEDYALLKQEVMKPDYNLANAELITGVSAEDIATMAKMIGTATKTALYYAMGITQHTSGYDNVVSTSNLQLLCGNIGVNGAGLNPLRGQSNVQGACDMGALPNYYPGYQKINPSNNAKFAKAWGNTSLNSEIGLAATEIMHAIVKGKLDALYILGENPVLSDPDQAHVVAALSKIKFMVVQDIFLTETAQMAHVVLPATSFAEKDGHFTNTERRVQQLRVALTPPGEAIVDWKIIQMIANTLGANWNYHSTKDIWDEINHVTPQYQGLTWQRLEHKVDGLQWPCFDENHPGTPILHTETFLRGKGRMIPVSYRLPAEMPDSEYPLTLSTGRLLEQFHTGTMTRKTPELDIKGSPRVMISVYDAEKLGVSNGDMLILSTRRGTIEIAAFVTKRAQVGVLFLPFHFAEAAANKLTINALDPIAKIPEYKVCAVKAEKLHPVCLVE
ncbi:formate dehydrogenase subunit alpha [Shewanella polaris]|uniref:Formate dehydrogenase subunit alpha n=1 Tax=Shewanella polaris TaxID=2588449 RepID=A0A4Y5YIA3_9GAMM|nr:formate dehydrogenase subunit alpha [Shewanella polaris]QDE32335.1 formate dehydrogenase subunit alpha [Shewanella polaris]